MYLSRSGGQCYNNNLCQFWLIFGKRNEMFLKSFVILFVESISAKIFTKVLLFSKSFCFKVYCSMCVGMKKGNDVNRSRYQNCKQKQTSFFEWTSSSAKFVHDFDVSADKMKSGKIFRHFHTDEKLWLMLRSCQWMETTMIITSPAKKRRYQYQSQKKKRNWTKKVATFQLRANSETKVHWLTKNQWWLKLTVSTNRKPKYICMHMYECTHKFIYTMYVYL
jgi:hypothetical protein